jgi:molybdopterin-guanine dinucleotide biosynthesis protein
MEWEQIREHALNALDARITREEKQARLTFVTEQAYSLPEHKPWMVVHTSIQAPFGGWTGRDFFLIDASTRHAPDAAKHRAQLKYRPEGRRLVLDITPEIHRALGAATHVHVAYLDSTELNLSLQLRAQLCETSHRGPMLEDLWSDAKPRPLSYSPSHGLNAGQAASLDAMTGGGGWLVWGPPGTGKTKVISGAVAEARKHDRTVLITSHTHVAVDNVVVDSLHLAAEPGELIRVGSDVTKIDSQVAGHDYVLLDKAAAVLTHREERLAMISARQDANRTHPNRQRYEEVCDALSDVDVCQLNAASTAVDAAAAAQKLEAAIARDQAIQVELSRSLSALADERAPLHDQAASVQNCQEQLARAKQELSSAQSKYEEATDNLSSLRLEYTKSLLTQRKLKRDAHKWTSKLRRRRTRLCASLDEVVQQTNGLSDLAMQIEATLPGFSARVQKAEDKLHTAERALNTSTGAQLQDNVLRDKQTAIEEKLATLKAATHEQEEQLIKARQQAGSFPDAAQFVKDATDQGIYELLARRDELTELVGELESELGDLNLEKTTLEDEYRDTTKSLLETAPIVATTLTSLATKTELANRRFDMVIVDEAATASVPQLIFAGSKADYGLSFVGDFLQNAPITDTADAVTDAERDLLPWQEDDIFNLLGITDRNAADRHPRCVALRTQYRYPPIIADIVNDFCYDGLLDSHKKNPASEIPVVTLVDTSGHEGAALQHAGASWIHPLGLELIAPIAALHSDQRLGFVCPYKAQADHAGIKAHKDDLNIECGTVHKFQGRQFSTVIFDLMQDAGYLRWAAQADLHGNKRAVSAAKLLNVALTRTKDRLYLIGDWNVIRRTNLPGMRAIAALDGKPNFTVLPAAGLISKPQYEEKVRVRLASAVQRPSHDFPPREQRSPNQS